VQNHGQMSATSAEHFTI